MNSDQNLLPPSRQENADLPHKVPGVTLTYGIAQELRRSQAYVLWAVFGATVFLNCLSEWNDGFTVFELGRSEVTRIFQAKHLIYTAGPLLFGRLADIYSRPISLAPALLFYMIGCTISAASSNVTALKAAVIFHTIGLVGLGFLATLLVADYTPLKWRGLGLSWTYVASLAISWVGPELYMAMERKWIYGIAAIAVPVLCIPAVYLLFSALHKHRVSNPSSHPMRLKRIPSQLDLIGLATFTLGFGLIAFSTKTLVITRENIGKYSPGRITMLVIGLLLAFPAFIYWEYYYASSPLMPRRTLYRKELLLQIVVIFLFQFLTAFPSRSLSYVRPLGGTIGEMGYLLSASSIAYYSSAPFLGVVYYITQRSKPSLIIGYIFFIVGCVLWLAAALHWGPAVDFDVPASKVYLYTSQVFIGIGSMAVEMSIMVGAQASVIHDDLAMVIALVFAWSSVSGTFGSSAAIAIFLREDTDRTKLLISLGLALGLSLLCLLLSFFVPNFALGDKQNAVERDYRMERDSRGDE